jgi:hypothetical protein
MTDYAGIKGTRVKYLTTDPTLTSDYEGQVWYNSTTGVNKAVVQIKAFSSGGALPATRSGSGGCGTQGAALNVGGEDGANLFNTTEEYNGFTWSAGGALNDGPGSFFNPIAGIQTAAVRVGGILAPFPTLTNAVENYNGTSWTTGTDIPANNNHGNLAGTQTAAILAGGDPGAVSTTLSWNGSSWTAVNSLVEGKANGAVAGLSSAMLASGGSDGTPGTGGFTDNVQSWDGTNWSTSQNLPAAKTNLRGWGTNTDAIVVGGRTRAPAASATSEQYDGTGWTASASLGSAAYLGSTAGGTSGSQLGIYAGGGRVNASTPTEEYRSHIFVTTKAAWASGNNLNQARKELGGAGTQTAAIAFGGSNPGGTAVNNSEEYDGSSWSEGNDLNTARRTIQGFGTQTAAVAVGGFQNPSGGYHSVEEYNGASWTANSAPGELGTGRYGAACAGIESAGLVFGGSDVTPGFLNQTEEYNGSAFAEQNNLNTARRGLGGAGTQTSAIALGGDEPGASNKSEEYNGASWTAGPTLSIARDNVAGAGATSDSALAFGGTTTGNNSGETTATELYNGTVWASSAPLATARYYLAGCGTTSAALAFGGNPGPGTTNATEEFTGEVQTITGSTLTTS